MPFFLKEGAILKVCLPRTFSWTCGVAWVVPKYLIMVLRLQRQKLPNWQSTWELNETPARKSASVSNPPFISIYTFHPQTRTENLKCISSSHQLAMGQNVPSEQPSLKHDYATQCCKYSPDPSLEEVNTGLYEKSSQKTIEVWRVYKQRLFWGDWTWAESQMALGYPDPTLLYQRREASTDTWKQVIMVESWPCTCQSWPLVSPFNKYFRYSQGFLHNLLNFWLMVLVQLVCCLSPCPLRKALYPLEGDAPGGADWVNCNPVQPAEISKEKQKKTY